MNEEPTEWVFLLPQDPKHRDALEAKRLEYYHGLIADLRAAPIHDVQYLFHSDDGDIFRLRYLKFIILSTILMAAEATRKKALPNTHIALKEITWSYTSSFRIYQYPTELEYAAEVINDYLNQPELLLAPA